MKKKTVRALGAMGLLAIVAWRYAGPAACPPAETSCVRPGFLVSPVAAESRRRPDGGPVSPSP